jgi:RNA polymerase sigma-70 factor, ECF subfamily
VSREDDHDLMARIAAGDRSSIGVLYDRYAPLMLATATRMLGGRREAEDLLHDVLLEVWHHAGDYDADKGTLRTWLLLRLRSRALDLLGRAEATRTRPLEDADGEGLAETGSLAEASADRIAIRQGLEALDPDVRAVLELTYFRGLTAQAISDHLGVPVGTVRSRLARGLDALRAMLHAREGERAR